jgi:hypothetical protein
MLALLVAPAEAALPAFPRLLPSLLLSKDLPVQSQMD